MTDSTQRPPRVVFVTDQMQDVRLVEGFAARFDLTVLAPAYLERFTTWPASGEAFRLVQPSGGRSIFALRAAWWLLRNKRLYDVVIAQDNLTAAAGANLSALLTRRKVVLRLGRTTEEYFRCRRATGQGGVGYWVGLAVVKVLVNFNERRAAAIGASSRHIANSSSHRNRRIEVIPAYGVDPGIFSPDLSRQRAREVLGLPGSGWLVLCRSRIAPEKDPETYLGAMKLLADKGITATGVYVGGEFREFLELASTFAGVRIIARDAVHPSQLAMYYRACDVVVQTSRAEGFGISPIEALACGVPVVASATGGLVETVIDGETGSTVPAGDPEATAAAIGWTLTHYEQALEMADRGRRMVLQRFTSDKAFEGWAGLVHRVITR